MNFECRMQTISTVRSVGKRRMSELVVNRNIRNTTGSDAADMDMENNRMFRNYTTA
jgi:hypothetical protein